MPVEAEIWKKYRKMIYGPPEADGEVAWCKRSWSPGSGYGAFSLSQVASSGLKDSVPSFSLKIIHLPLIVYLRPS